jgi:hypothetical protein
MQVTIGMSSLVIRRIGVNMQVVYIVKSFGPENGYVNLKAFADHDDAVQYAWVVEKQIPEGTEDEFVQIEELVVDYG